MNIKTEELVKQAIKNSNGSGKMCFRGLNLPDAKFEGMELRGADFRNARLICANFRGANLKYANFESANLYAADFTDANCHRTNFKDATLSMSKFYPKDCFGVTVTLECRSFQGMEIDPGWWWGWLMYALLMKPPTKEAEDRLIQAMGAERYMVLRQQYMRREL